MSPFELFKCNQVSWIGLYVIKNDKQSWVSGVINHRIIQNVGLLSCICGPLGSLTVWKSPHSRMSDGVFTCEDITEVHVHPLESLGIWSRVCIGGRISSINSKIYTFSECSSWKWNENKSFKVSFKIFSN